VFEVNIQSTSLPGLFLGEPKCFVDPRGSFVKTFHEDTLRAQGLAFTLREEFYSTSRAGVLRGMHFQKPPMDHTKIVTCLSGKVRDVVVDLRKGSPTYGRAAGFELSSQNRAVLWISPGLAHGFLALEDQSLVHYKTSSVHSPECDFGIRWDSFGYDWGVTEPLLSERDAAFPRLEEFASPFVWEGGP
jgi:dTDP-4-dehydrorhamnose 3,5-epimerase